MTAQISDSFIYHRQKVTLLAEENFPLYDPIADGYKPEAMSSACWRGFVCEYEIARGRLFLNKLRINDESRGLLEREKSCSWTIQEDYLLDLIQILINMYMYIQAFRMVMNSML